MKNLDHIRRIVGDDLLMLFGDTGSGKSKMSYVLAKEALEAGQKVIFLDTERNLSRDEMGALGDSYVYTPVFTEIQERVASLGPAHFAILDSIGLPVLIQYARMNLKQRLDALLQMAAILGDLKDWTYKNHALAIVTNQPVSEFMSIDEQKQMAKVWGNGDARRPFGGKGRHVAKEIWRTQRISGTPTLTKIIVSAYRSRELGSGVIIAEGKITNDGLSLDFKFTPTISDSTIADLLAAIEGAGNMNELTAIGQQIATISVTQAQRDRLRALYKKQATHLAASEMPWSDEEKPPALLAPQEPSAGEGPSEEEHEGDNEGEGKETPDSGPGGAG